MKSLKKLLCLFAVSLIFACIMQFQVSAATTYYQTNKANVPIWSSASSSSTKVKTIATSGTVLRIISSTKNSAGNLWYKIYDGTWVFSGNVKSHSHSYSGYVCTGISCGYKCPHPSYTGGYCNTCNYQWPYTVYSFSGTYEVTNSSGAIVRSRPYSNNSTTRYTAKYGSVVYLNGKTTNQEGNVWYRLTDGNWLYSGNVSKHSHKYSGGICYSSGCGYEWPYSVSSYSGTFVVTNSSGAKLWTRPYSNNSTHKATSAYGTALSIVGKTTNQENHLWYKVSNGYWVYSENVTQRFTVSYSANGGSGAPSSQNVLSGNYLKLSSTQPYRNGYIFKGWATSSTGSVKYSAGGSYKFTSNTTLYAVWSKCAHSSYTGGYCNSCGYEWPYSVSSYSGTFIVTNSSGAKLWTRPYSNNSTHKATSAYGTALSIVGKTTNQENHLWYKVSNGYWVYSENVTQRFTVSYSANGGSGAPSSQNVLSGNYLKLSSSKPTRNGYTFKGWATSSTGSVKYSAGGSYKFASNTTLYAVWSKCSHSSYTGGYCNSCGYEWPYSISSYKDTLVVNNASGAKLWSRPYSNKSTHKATAAYGTALSIIAKTTNKENNLWYKTSNGYWVFSGNLGRRFNVTYNANGGSGAPSSQYAISDNYLKLSSSKPTRNGYTFKGWATSSTGSVKYSAGGSYKFTSNATLYAVWSKSKCTHSSYTGGYCNSCGYEWPYSVSSYSGTFIVTNSSGAKLWTRPYSNKSTHKATATYGTVLSIIAKTTNKENNLWYKTSNGYWVFSGNVGKKINVTYNANGGKNAPQRITVTSGIKTTISSTVPTRFGHKFLGWSTSANGKASYKSGKSYVFSKNTTLYAVWEKYKYMNTSVFKNSKEGFLIPDYNTDFVAQGVCYVDNLGMFAVSGYMENGSNSRIYIINAKTGEYKYVSLQTSGGTKYKDHAGGIAANGNDLWISSGGSDTKNGTVYHISVTTLKNAKSGDYIKFDKSFSVPCKGSALYCDGKTLWVCEFYKAGSKKYAVNPSHKAKINIFNSNNAWACGYNLSSITKSTYESSSVTTPNVILSIPDKVQGMCITDKGKVIFSTSYGKTSDSYLYAYDSYKKWNTTKAKINGKNVTVYIAGTGKSNLKKITMPCLMEGLEFHNGKMYAIFESGTKKYYYEASQVIPHAVEVNINKIL